MKEQKQKRDRGNDCINIHEILFDTSLPANSNFLFTTYHKMKKIMFLLKFPDSLPCCTLTPPIPIQKENAETEHIAKKQP